MDVKSLNRMKACDLERHFLSVYFSEDGETLLYIGSCWMRAEKPDPKEAKSTAPRPMKVTEAVSTPLIPSSG